MCACAFPRIVITPADQGRESQPSSRRRRSAGRRGEEKLPATWDGDSTTPHARKIVPEGKSPAHWLRLHERLVADAISWHPEPTGASARVLLLGDSQTERLRGTRFGDPFPPGFAHVIPSVLRESRMAARWSVPMSIGIGGDQTQHLLWRIRNGEVTEAMAADRSLVINLLIGTNNLGLGGHSARETADGIDAVVATLLERTNASLLVNALLPRKPPPKCGGRNCLNYDKAIDLVNTHLREKADSQWRPQHPSRRIAVADCGRVFRPRHGGGLNFTLMPDGLHPNPEGYRLLLDCWEHQIGRLIKG